MPSLASGGCSGDPLSLLPLALLGLRVASSPRPHPRHLSTDSPLSHSCHSLLRCAEPSSGRRSSFLSVYLPRAMTPPLPPAPSIVHSWTLHRPLRRRRRPPPSHRHRKLSCCHPNQLNRTLRFPIGDRCFALGSATLLITSRALSTWLLRSPQAVNGRLRGPQRPLRGLQAVGDPRSLLLRWLLSLAVGTSPTLKGRAATATTKSVGGRGTTSRDTRTPSLLRRKCRIARPRS